MSHAESSQGQVDKISNVLGRIEQDIVETKQHITTDLVTTPQKHSDGIAKLQCDQLTLHQGAQAMTTQTAIEQVNLGKAALEQHSKAAHT